MQKIHCYISLCKNKTAPPGKVKKSKGHAIVQDS